jgi:hypothetical protein
LFGILSKGGKCFYNKTIFADPNATKQVTEKRLIFTGQKISILALQTASLEPIWGPPVKSQKKLPKNRFYRKSFENKKILSLKMSRKSFSTKMSGQKYRCPFLTFEIPYFKLPWYLKMLSTVRLFYRGLL